MRAEILEDFLRTSRQLDGLVATPNALLAEVRRQQQELRFATIDLPTTWRLGSLAREVALARELPVAIEIMLGVQRVFHAATPGSTADNDAWARRKGQVVDRCLESSLAVGLQFERDGRSWDLDSRLPVSDYAAHGGCFPLLLTTGVLVGHLAVSGLPSIHDHALAVTSIRAILAEDHDGRGASAQALRGRSRARGLCETT